MGRIDDAVSLLEAAIESTGFSVSVAANLAILLERRGRLDKSVEIAKRALEMEPTHADARLTLGLALLRLGSANEALPHFQRLASDYPDNPIAFLNLGEALMALDDYDQALVAYDRALSINPQSVPARIGKGQALAMLRCFEEADAKFLDLLHTAPGEATACIRQMAAKAGQRIPPGWQARAVEVYLSRRWEQQTVCDWRHRADYFSELCRYAEKLKRTQSAAYDISLAFQTMATPLTANHRQSLLEGVAKAILSSRVTLARRRLERIPGPLRLGFLSAGFRDHPSAQLHWRHLAFYDRGRFRVHAYSLADDPTSDLRKRVAKNVDSFCVLSHATAEEAGWRIARDGIDILVDLAGYSEFCRPEILAMRPAPIRVSYHGSPVSMGARLVDYRIADRIVSPDTTEFNEAMAYLPAPHYMYNDAEPIADHLPSRLECGLPEQGFVFCAFNSAFKIEPEIFGVWMTLLLELPGSVLWLMDAGPSMRDNLRREAGNRGVAGERLVFAPRIDRAAHLARHACADLFLDTFLCNAHTTALDALWAGLPILTRAGETMAARFAASFISVAGLPELVVKTTGDYLALARHLATSPPLLAELRQRLAKNRHNARLFNTKQRVGYLSRAFETMWERHCRGEPPATFDVSES